MAGCIKPEHGSCSLEAMQDPSPVICCPNRLYAANFRILQDVSELAFGSGMSIIKPNAARHYIAAGSATDNQVVTFGKYSGQELPLPNASGTGSYYLDWVLAKLSRSGRITEMTALEVQTIDTTGRYRDQAQNLFLGQQFRDAQGRTPGYSSAGFNWENVNKRILPQVIYKGHAIRREPRCTKGLFFACPKAVYDRILARLGGIGAMLEYPLQPGAITFIAYDLGAASIGHHRPLRKVAHWTTTVDQVALAFTAPRNLPPVGVYENAANSALGIV
ncbi:Type II restriction-modification system restriction subunit [Roseomonas mucosa]|nr:Type II restriction-modification system restriction subunit [Roseomonas mucosa]